MNRIRNVMSEDQLEKAIQATYPKIYAYVYRRTMNQALSKDITQETFYHFFSHRMDYDERGKFLNYLYRIANHLLMDQYKRKDYECETLFEEQADTHSVDALQFTQKKEERYILRKWIKELPLHLQEVLLLRYDEELKFKDIASITGLHISTIKSQVKLAIDMLEAKARKEGWK